MNTPINTPIRTAVAVALGIAAFGTPLLAQASAPTTLAAAFNVAPSGKVSDPITAASTRFARADELVQRGRIPAASREYIAIAKMQRAQNVLPSEAMWKLADLYNTYERSPERTADVLVALAADAQRFGDPQTEAKALLEATVLYSKASMPVKANECADRLDVILTSPLVTDEVRREAQSRIVRK